MGESNRRVIKFLEELKTFLAKNGIKEHLRVGSKRVLLSPTYYKDRVKEAKKLVNELRKSN